MFYGNVSFKLQVDWFIKIEEGHGLNNNKGRKSWKKELLSTHHTHTKKGLSKTHMLLRRFKNMIMSWWKIESSYCSGKKEALAEEASANNDDDEGDLKKENT